MAASSVPSARRYSASAVAASLVLLAVVAAAPSLGVPPNTLRLMLVTFVWITCSLAWNLLGGLAGQVSFGFAVFYGLGAYTTVLLINARAQPYLALAAGGLVAALASVVIGLPTFRLRGPYFAIATIGVSEAVRVVMSNLSITGGASGLRLMERGPFRQLEHYYVALAVAVLAMAVSAFISRSHFGLALRAIRNDEDAAADVGVRPFAFKLVIHLIAAGLTGLAGGAYARYAAYIHPDGVFAFATGVSILLMPVIGGLGTLTGPVLGAVIYSVVQEEMIVRFPELHLLLYGTLLILIVLFEPGGLVGLARRLARPWLPATGLAVPPSPSPVAADSSAAVTGPGGERP